MDDIRLWETITRDLSGNGRFRLILQPTMAVILGVRLGIADAKEGAAPFLWRLFTTRGRRKLFAQSLHDVIIPFCVALVIDGVLQYFANGRVRPLVALVVGTLLVWLPFAVSRALTNRVWRRMRPSKPSPAARPRRA
jgi:di/tricarboxylate transporter